MRLILIDDHRIVRDGLRAIFASEPGLDVLCDAGDGDAAVELARCHEPDVVLLDTHLSGMGAAETTRRIVSASRRVAVLALAPRVDAREVTEVLDGGALGFVSKQVAASELVEAVRDVASGRRHLSADVMAVMHRSPSSAPGSAAARERALSTREREVLRLLAEGRTSKQIASALHVAVSTVESHRRQIVAKVGLRSVADLTKYAVREGLTPLR